MAATIILNADGARRLIQRIVLPAMNPWVAQMLDGEGSPLWLRLVVAAIVCAVGWQLLRPRWDFTIAVDQRGVRLDGRIPQAQQARIVQFCKEKLGGAAGRLKIRGRRVPGGRLVLRFHGAVDEGLRQQVRNYLTTVL